MRSSRQIIAVLGLLALSLGITDCTLDDWDVVSSYQNTLGTTHTHTLAMELPESLSAPAPAIVFIHGGWYAGGSYTDFHSDCRAAAQKGYVAVSIDYHPTPYQDNPNGKAWPEQLNDAKSAIQWLRSEHVISHNGKLYRLDRIINPNAIGVAGISAGGHAALMLGLTNSTMHNPLYSYAACTDVQAVCSLAGPTHYLSEYFEAQSYPSPKAFINAMLSHAPRFESLGACDSASTFENNRYCSQETDECIQENVPANSPSPLGLLAYISPYYQFCTNPDGSCNAPIANTVPIMMIIGTDDTVVPYASQHVPFFNKLTGPKEEVVYCPDGNCVCGHTFNYHTNDRRMRMFAFFDKHLR